MRLLLDEMISPRIARELREHGHDVQAVKETDPISQVAATASSFARCPPSDG